MGLNRVLVLEPDPAKNLSFGLSDGSYFQNNDTAFFAYDSRFMVQSVISPLTFIDNLVGVEVEACQSSPPSPPPAVVDGVEFEMNTDAATLWRSSDFSLKNSFFEKETVGAFLVGDLRTKEIRLNNFMFESPGDTAIRIDLGSPVSQPPSPLSTLTVKQNNFWGYEPDPGVYAIRLVHPEPPACGSGSITLDAIDNWWGCDAWTSGAGCPAGGPVIDCCRAAMGSNYPPCATISVIPPGISWDPPSTMPNTP